jgi:hypothetical protein
MRAPMIFVVVGWNRCGGDLIAWFFDEQEANERCKALGEDAGDKYAYRVMECQPPDGEPRATP